MTSDGTILKAENREEEEVIKILRDVILLHMIFEHLTQIRKFMFVIHIRKNRLYRPNRRIIDLNNACVFFFRSFV